MKLIVQIPALNEEQTIAETIAAIPRRIPGISRVEKDNQGNFVLDDMPEEDIRRLMDMCEQEMEEERVKN